MSGLILAGLCSLALTFFSGLVFIPVLKNIKAGQPILKYVKEHEQKSGTPTMYPSLSGFFICSSDFWTIFSK